MNEKISSILEFIENAREGQKYIEKMEKLNLKNTPGSEEHNKVKSYGIAFEIILDSYSPITDEFVLSKLRKYENILREIENGNKVKSKDMRETQKFIDEIMKRM
ncbi:MAG: hypothetical protein ACE5WD_13300 [Candidatus Aminicenantia bacterium]